MVMLTLKEFMDCQNSFETETEYGEPQHWVYLKSGRSIEVTYENIASVNFVSENHAFTIRYHCSEKEFDDNDFHGTNGVIEAYCYTKPDMALQCIYNLMKAYHEEEDIKEIKKEITLTQWHFDHTCQCLIDNGIDEDEADTVAEALFAIICDVDTDMFMKED